MTRSGSIARLLEVASSLLVIVAALALLWSLASPAGESLVPREPTTDGTDDAVGLHVDAQRLRNVKGEGGFIIIEFADFECPYCRRHATETLPQIMRDLVDTGRSRYAFVNFPLEQIHPSALMASEAAECAGRQGQYWTMHERLFAQNVPLSSDAVLSHARTMALDEGAFRDCLNGATIQLIRDDVAQGRQLGVEGTPAFFFGRVAEGGGAVLWKRLKGAAPFVTFETLVQELYRNDGSTPLTSRGLVWGFGPLASIVSTSLGRFDRKF